MTARCCWCNAHFIKTDGHYWCPTLRCQDSQKRFAISYTNPQTGQFCGYLYVPLPKQVESARSKATHILSGGSAGPGKSTEARWGKYRRALMCQGYRALILRETWNELEKHHLDLMQSDAEVFRRHGIRCEYRKAARELVFLDTDAKISGGHMADPTTVKIHFGRELDDIDCDEGSQFQPQALLDLSTRARSTKPEIVADGGAKFAIRSNPGGPAATMIRDFFIDHTPDFDQHPQLAGTGEDGKPMYNPDDWAYIASNLEDNPYLEEGYERKLAVSSAVRYQQLRHNDWDVLVGQFFPEFNSRTHVKDFGPLGKGRTWFRSMDWGYMEPGHTLWWCSLPDGMWYVRYEQKFQGTLIPNLCRAWKDIDRSLGITHLQYTVGDKFSMSQSPEEVGEARGTTFRRCGVPIRDSISDHEMGWHQCRELLAPREDGTPTVIIHPSCRVLIRGFAGATSNETHPDDMDRRLPEIHAMDAFRYGAMSQLGPMGRRRTETLGEIGRMRQQVMRRARRAA